MRDRSSMLCGRSSSRLLPSTGAVNYVDGKSASADGHPTKSVCRPTNQIGRAPTSRYVSGFGLLLTATAHQRSARQASAHEEQRARLGNWLARRAAAATTRAATAGSTATGAATAGTTTARSAAAGAATGATTAATATAARDDHRIDSVLVTGDHGRLWAVERDQTTRVVGASGEAQGEQQGSKGQLESHGSRDVMSAAHHKATHVPTRAHAILARGFLLWKGALLRAMAAFGSHSETRESPIGWRIRANRASTVWSLGRATARVGKKDGCSLSMRRCECLCQRTASK